MRVRIVHTNLIVVFAVLVAGCGPAADQGPSLAATIEQDRAAANNLNGVCLAHAHNDLDKLDCAYQHLVEIIRINRISCDGRALSSADRIICATDEQTELTQAADEQRATLARIGVSQ